MSSTELPSFESVLADELQDPEFRERWERLAFARAVANRILTYRIEHRLTQTEIACRVGVSQSVIARLEAGEHEPTLATLARLSKHLGITFHIDITPDMLQLIA